MVNALPTIDVKNNFEDFEKKIRDSNTNIGEVQITWQALKNLLHDLTSNEVEVYRWTYFRLFTEFNWKLFSALERQDVKVAFQKQIPLALVLDNDVSTKLMWYLSIHTIDQDDLKKFYTELRETFLSSDAIVGAQQGKEVAVKDLVAEIKQIKQSGKDPEHAAVIINKVKELLFPKGDELVAKYAIADPEVATERFIHLINFFLDTGPDRIWSVVDAFVNPERYRAPAKPVAEEPKEKDALKPAEAPKPHPARHAPAHHAHAHAEKKHEKHEKKVEHHHAKKEEATLKKPTTAEIKANIESHFAKDANGQFLDVAGVMNKLNQIARKYNDPAIGDLYYFDENVGQFKWNV